MRAKLPSGGNQRKTVGMFKCKKNCVICPYIKLVKQVKSKKTGEIIKMTHKFDCNTTGVIYMTECHKCGLQYIGQTFRRFGTRMREHRNDIINGKDTANGEHYNSKGHKLSDLRIMVIERVVPNEGAFLLEREEMWIKRLETKRPHGLNRND